MGKGSSKSKQQIAAYQMSLHLGFCHSVDALLELFVKEKSVWKGAATSNAAIEINQQNLFGGTKKEGGLFGAFQILHGRSDQVLPSGLASRLGRTPETCPGFRDILSLFFYGAPGQGFLWSHNYPYLHTIWGRVKRTMNGGSQWYPEKAEIGGFVPYSEDFQWQTRTNAFGVVNITDVAYSAGTFIAVGVGGTMSMSPDGINWAAKTPSYPPGCNFTSVAGSNGTFVAVGDSGAFRRSVDGGETWTTVDKPSYPFTVWSVCGYNGAWVIGSQGQDILYSSDDGVTWTQVLAPVLNDTDFTALATSGTIWIAGGYRGALVRSVDNGHTWSNVTSGFAVSDVIINAEFADGLFMICGTNGKLATSSDGVTWTLRSTGLTGTIYDAVHVGGDWIAINATESVRSKDGGATWESMAHPVSGLTDMVSSATTAVAVGTVGGTMSTDLVGVVPVYPDMNPAHIIRECLTNVDWGMGMPAAFIDDVSFAEAADILYGEDFGLSMLWSGQTDIQTFVNEVLNHVDGVYGIDPDTNKFFIKLIRGGYDLGTLETLNEDECVITSFNRKAFEETTNEIVCTWTNPENEGEETVVVHDLANYSAQGVLISSSRNYYGIRNSNLAIRAALRELNKASQPIAVFEVTASRKAWKWKSGDVIKVTYPEYGLSSLPCRITSINYGKPGEMGIKIALVEDVFDMPSDSYVINEGSLWEPPLVTVSTIIKAMVGTAPFFALARGLGEAAALAVPYPTAYPLLLSAGNTAAAEVFSEQMDAAGNTTYASTGEYDCAGYATLADSVVPEVTSTLTLSGFFGAIRPASGILAVIGSLDGEIAIVESGDDTSATVRRGMLDTVPKAWPAETPVWFVDWDSNLAGANLVVGETKTYRLAPPGHGGSGYKTAGATFTSRHYRPFRPGNVKVNSSLYPAAFTGEMVIAWSHRNRQVENSVPLKWDEASVTPESGTTYSLRVYDQVGALLASIAGITADTYTLPISAELDGDPDWPSVVLALHMDDVGLTDGKGHAITLHNGAARSATQSKFGGYAAYFDGTDDYISAGSHSGYDISSSDFTIECWIYPTVAARSVISRRSTGANGWVLTTIGMRAKINGVWSDYQLSWTQPALNQWHHMAWVRSGTTIYGFVDGILSGTRTGVTSIHDQAEALLIGAGSNADIEYPFAGYIDDVLFTPGVARYTSDFTIPVSAFPDSEGEGLNDKLTFELESVRDGYASFQKVVQTVDRAGYGFHYGKYYGGM